MATDRERGYRWKKLSEAVVRREKAKHGGKVFCHLCDREIDLTLKAGPWRLEIDHIVPRSQSPALAMIIENLAPSCRTCNRLRGDRSVDECVGTPQLKAQFAILSQSNADSWEAKQRAAAIAPNAPKTKLWSETAATTAPDVRKVYRRGIDYPPFCPMTGMRNPEATKVRPYFNPAFAPWGDEPPYDENTGQRRPGVEWPIGSGNYGL
ncbi:HNH endonuclease [Rhodococcus sp. USK10]|uniref:HNH endonuclease n=1 Tax=Rhodococcus sp. USK10 TaxID=2789739 RepID=UPI001C5F4162|nr:HNH endonuclease signature motif containing protein [Rhodococcus sp. USK10]QYB05407.1 HNH endonuclease [Rhodococcus sp. USK10]